MAKAGRFMHQSPEARAAWVIAGGFVLGKLQHRMMRMCQHVLWTVASGQSMSAAEHSVVGCMAGTGKIFAHDLAVAISSCLHTQSGSCCAYVVVTAWCGVFVMWDCLCLLVHHSRFGV